MKRGVTSLKKDIITHLNFEDQIPFFTGKTAILSKRGHLPYSYPWRTSRGRKGAVLWGNSLIKWAVLWGKTLSLQKDNSRPVFGGLWEGLIYEGVWEIVWEVVVGVFGSCLWSFWVFEWGSSSRPSYLSPPPKGFRPLTTPPYSGVPPEEASSPSRLKAPAPLWTPRLSALVTKNQFQPGWKTSFSFIDTVSPWPKTWKPFRGG